MFGRERGVIKEEIIQFTARSPSYTITNYFDNNLTADAAEEIINKARSMVSLSISSEPRRLLSQMQPNSLYYRLWNQDFNYEKYNNQFVTWCRYGVRLTFNYRVLEYPFTPGDILELSSLYGCLHYAIHVSSRPLGANRYEARIIHVAGPDSEEMPSPERAVVKEDVIQFSATAPPYIISNYFDDHWPVSNDILKKAYSKVCVSISFNVNRKYSIFSWESGSSIERRKTTSILPTGAVTGSPSARQQLRVWAYQKASNTLAIQLENWADQPE